MAFHLLKIGRLKRKLPIVSLGPKIKVASFNLMGDRVLVEVLAKSLARKLRKYQFDFLVGPEVKVVPLLHELSRILAKKRYVICRKSIHGYMVSPLRTPGKNGLVLDGTDAELIKDKKIIIVDDVVSSGNTLRLVENLTNQAGASVVARVAVFKQGGKIEKEIPDLIFLDSLPVFDS